MSATKLQELEEMAAELLAAARKLRPGPDRISILREIARFRARITDLQCQERSADQGSKAKGK